MLAVAPAGPVGSVVYEWRLDDDASRSPRARFEHGRSLRSLAGVDLLARGGCSVAEAAIAGVVLVGAAFAAFGAHVADGGFELDDWSWAAQHQSAGGFFAFAGDLLGTSLSYAGTRPGEAVYFTVMYGLFGSNPAGHIAVTVALAGLMSTAVYCVLRTLGMERLHAGAIGLLLVLFPATDADRLWLTVGYAHIAICLYACGLLCTLRAFRLSGRRALAWHVAGVVLYGASLLTYEIAVGGVLLTVLVYRFRTDWRTALRRWVADLALLIPAGLYDHHTKGASFSLGHIFHQGRTIAHQAWTLLTRLGIQTGPARLPAYVIVLLVVAAAGAVFLVPLAEDARRPLRRWLAVCAGGVIVVGAGYVPFLGSNSFYLPLRPGFGNRTNFGAAAGFVIVIYALAVLAGRLVALAPGLRRRREASVSVAAVVTAAGVATVAGLWANQIRDDRLTWDRARTVNDRTLAAVRRAGKPPSGSTIYTFGVPGTTAPFVFTFSVSWDLTGAVQLLWHDPTLHGVPSPSIAPSFVNVNDPSLAGNTPANSGFACRRRDVRPRGWLYYDRDASPYGKTLFVDVPRHRSALVRDRRTCLAWAARELG